LIFVLEYWYARLIVTPLVVCYNR